MHVVGAGVLAAVFMLGTASAQSPTWPPASQTQSEPAPAPTTESATESATEPAPGTEAAPDGLPPASDSPVSPSPSAAPSSPRATTLEPAPTPPAPERGVTLLDQQRASARRWSRFSAGPGGPVYFFTELLSGVTTGALVGGEIGGKDGAYLGAVSSGAFFGALAAIDQYYRPVGHGSASMIALATGTGFLAGFGIAGLADLEDRDKMWAVFGSTHAASLAAVLATWAVEDVSGADASLVGMGTTYAFALTGLVLLIMDADRGDVPATALLLAPAAGMAIGGALAPFVELSPSRVLLLTGLPLGVGAALLGIGQLADNDVIAPATALAGVVTTFGLTLLFSGEPPSPVVVNAGEKDETGLAFIPMLQPSGRRNESIAVGPGVLGRF